MACSRSELDTSDVGRMPSSAAPTRPPRAGRKRKRTPSRPSPPAAVSPRPPPPFPPQLPRPRLSHRGAERRIVEQALDRGRNIVGALPDAEAVAPVRDHFAKRRDITADDWTLVQPRLEVADAEGLVQGRHGEDIAGVQRGGFFAAAGALDVDDALVGVSRELVEKARVKTRDTDEHEARVRMPSPHQLGRIEQMDVPLVALLASDVEDQRGVRR